MALEGIISLVNLLPGLGNIVLLYIDRLQLLSIVTLRQSIVTLTKAKTET